MSDRQPGAEEHVQKSAETLAVIKRMEAALGDSELDMTPYFHDDFQWVGNQGCGTKPDLESFRRNWQWPFRAAFSDRTYKTEQFIADGEWASCFGYIEATHSGEFMGIPATGKRIKIPYMDFWEVRDGKIADNRVSVDFALVLQQLGVDVFDGKGWENYDAGKTVPPKPDSYE